MKVLYLILIHLGGVVLLPSELFGQQSTRAGRDNAQAPGVTAIVTVDYKVGKFSKTEVRFAVAFRDFSIDASRGYTYEGKTYRQEVPGLMELLEKASGEFPTVRFDVYYGPHKQGTVEYQISARDGNLGAFTGDGILFATTEDKVNNLSPWRLEAVFLESFLYRPDPTLWTSAEYRIKDYLKAKDQQKKYEDKIREADASFNGAATEQELTKARGLYYQAKQLKSSEPYPQDQMARIDERIKALRQKEQADKSANAKAGEASSSPGSDRASQAHSGSANTGEARKPASVNARAGGQKQTVTAEDINRQIQKQNDDYWAGVEASNRRIEAQTDRMLRSFYAAQAVSESRHNLNNLRTLSGNYASMDELEAEFNEKYQAISAEVNHLAEARQDMLSSSVDAAFYGSDATGQAVGETITMVGALVNDARAEKEKREAREALERARHEEMEKLNARRRALQKELRTKLFSQFPDGGMPLSALRVDEPVVWFFAYVFNKKELQSENPGISVTNVFAISKYSDDTWPYKSSLKTSVVKLADHGEATLVGYYLDQQKAQEMLASFRKLAAKSQLVIRDITFEGAATATAAAPQTSGSSAAPPASDHDFWEDGGANSSVSNASATSDAASWYNEGLKHEKAGDTAKALDAYTKATQLDPTLPDPWFNLGVHYFNLGADRVNSAAKMSDEAYKTGGKAIMEEARAYFRQALPALEKVHSLTPADAGAIRALKVIYKYLNRPDDAARMERLGG